MPTTFKNLPTTLKKEKIGEWYHNKKGGKMRVKRLTLENFQGVRSFTLDADCKDCTIRGINGSGKTTIFSAYCFLLYNLDSTGGSFLPKSIDETGEARHGVDSSVEAVFVDNNEQEFTLKKVFKEVWRRKHGSPKKIFTGHSTAHFWDSVSITEKEYKRRLTEIAPESVLKLLVNTRCFSEILHWQKRREILLDICGDISDKDIIKSNPALSRIVEILDGKSLEDQKKIITAQKTKLNKELETLPVRIDEVSKGQSDITNLNLSTIEKELSEISKALTEKNEEAARIESGGEIAEKIKKQREIESRLLEIENKILAARNWAEAEQRKKVSEFETMQRKKLSGLEKDLDAEMSAHARVRIAIKGREADNRAAEQEMAKLRLDWDAINEAVFDESSTICPTCGQEYPENQADEIRETFHTEKAKELDRINQTGRGIGNEVTERKNQNETDQADVALYEKKIEEITEQINKIKEQTPKSAKETEETIDKEQEALELDLIEIKMNINGLRANSHEEVEKVKAEIDAITEKQKAGNLKKQTLESHAKDQARIKELGEQQKMVAGEYEQLEEMLFIMDEFEKAKANLLEKSVNSHFKLAEFRLFNILVNGGLESCCETTYQGIGWHSGLNNSSQINVGVDVINTLNEHYGLTMPLMIDNAESILKVIPSKSQIIKLVVSETVQCTKCDWAGLHSETNKELDDDDIVIGEKCPKCDGDIKEYKGLVVRND